MKNHTVKIIKEKQAEIGEALRQQGWWTGRLLAAELAEALLDDASRLHRQQQFRAAAIGTQHNKLISHSVRGDETYWVEGSTPAQTEFLAAMLALKNLFESYFPISLHNFDGHYSYYPSGTFYQKHWDNARQSNNRIFSAVNYLNIDWKSGDGGELVLYSPDNSAELVRIPPVFGTTALFFSTDFPHEVCATLQPRYSLTGWFHRKT